MAKVIASVEALHLHPREASPGEIELVGIAADGQRKTILHVPDLQRPSATWQAAAASEAWNIDVTVYVMPAPADRGLARRVIQSWLMDVRLDGWA